MERIAMNCGLEVTMTMTTTCMEGWPSSGLYHHRGSHVKPGISWTRNFNGISYKPFLSTISVDRLNLLSSSKRTKMLLEGGNMSKRKGTPVVYPKISSPITTQGFLDGYDDEYGGLTIDPQCLPSSANAFASILHSSLSTWKLQGRKGIWLKILTEQADLLPIAIKEGFNFHHAEPGYVMLAYWIPDEPCMLPDGPSHQIGVGGFVINEQREVLVVKEKQCPCRCSGLWKLPTGFINKSEEIFSGVVREVKEETGVDTNFLEVIAFRHVHRMAFEKSDLMFVCMLKPLSSHITIDEKEIQAAKWMPLDEFVGQSYYQEDHMLKKAIDICIAKYENRYSGFIAHQLVSKFDGKLSYLYYNNF